MPDGTERVADGPFSLTLPASVANDIGRLLPALGQAAEQMGHPNCFSGCNPLYLKTQREFATDPEMVLTAIPTSIPVEATLVNRVDAFVPSDVTYDIESLKRVVMITAEKLNHKTCCSGFDVAFRRESEMISIGDEEARGSGR
jgi:hypothetical protein